MMASRRGGRSNRELVESMKENGVLKDPLVTEALLLIARGEFVPKEHEDEAYTDQPLRVASMLFNISAPHMYAVCLENLEFKEGLSVLDIGCGCGHLTALASYLVGKAGKVEGVELRQDILDFARANIKKVGESTGLDFSNITLNVRNCFLPTTSTYDRIHVGACCPEAQLDNLLKLLNSGGILVTPLGDHLVKIVKDKDGKPKTFKLMSVRYGDLIVPSEVEIKEAQKILDREKATTIVVPENTFPGDLVNLMNSKELSDVTLLVENEPVYAHKVILAARSEFFKAMFFTGLKESHEATVPLPNVPHAAFMDILKFIYSGDLTLNSPDHAIDILPTANYLRLNRLKALCEICIRDSVEIENAAYILAVASESEAWQLKSFVLDFIMSNYDAVSASKCFEELDKPLLLQVTREACKYFNNK
eukprot:TRINITY_DN7824_c0_g1_i4.p1 TRINITY_DN7824_c0_g1~~TRINITY_DN7824_c0_g1_i4.p1  ORF type:complete len:421 (-),score=124.42 TRINITY_DN7824_c0_g1_i4:41-1303(-)